MHIRSIVASAAYLLQVSIANASSGGQFAVGIWMGAPVESDPNRGCHMAAAFGDGRILNIYANDQEDFQLAIFSNDWNLRDGVDPEIQVLFDGKEVPLSGLEEGGGKLLKIFKGGEEDGFENLIVASKTIEVRSHTYKFVSELKLDGADQAVRELWKCVEMASAAPEEQATNKISSLPIEPGYYVGLDESCHEATDPNMVHYENHTMQWSRTSCKITSITQMASSVDYAVEEVCGDYEGLRETKETKRYHITSSASFSVSDDSGWSFEAKLCPSQELPEIYRGDSSAEGSNENRLLTADGQQAPLSQADLDFVKMRISLTLPDEEAVRFRGIQSAPNDMGSITVCGYVNAKNRYGAYDGYKPFMGFLSSDRTQFGPVFMNGHNIPEICRELYKVK